MDIDRDIPQIAPKESVNGGTERRSPRRRLLRRRTPGGRTAIGSWKVSQGRAGGRLVHGDDGGLKDGKAWRIRTHGNDENLFRREHVVKRLKPGDRLPGASRSPRPPGREAEAALPTLAGEWKERFDQMQASAPGQDRTPPVMIAVSGLGEWDFLVCRDPESLDADFREADGSFMSKTDPHGGKSRLPFVGRDAELEAIGLALREIRDHGKARTLHITGSRGCGKTRLLTEATDRARAEFTVAAVVQQDQRVREVLAQAMREMHGLRGMEGRAGSGLDRARQRPARGARPHRERNASVGKRDSMVGAGSLEGGAAFDRGCGEDLCGRREASGAGGRRARRPSFRRAGRSPRRGQPCVQRKGGWRISPAHGGIAAVDHPHEGGRGIGGSGHDRAPPAHGPRPRTAGRGRVRGRVQGGRVRAGP